MAFPTAIVWLAFLLPACHGQTFFLADSYSPQLTSGQLTISPFSFKGQSLGPQQQCLSLLQSDPENQVHLNACSTSIDLSLLSDKWAYNYSSYAFQSWGASGPPGQGGPLMCLDAGGLSQNTGSMYTKTYLGLTPCNGTLLQQWVWNGTTIKLAYSDWWIAFEGNDEPYFALSSQPALAEHFAFVIPLDDASGTNSYTPLPTQDYADNDIPHDPPENSAACGPNTYALNLSNPEQCQALCTGLVSSTCVAFAYQQDPGCCYLKSQLSGTPSPALYNMKKAVYMRGAVYERLFDQAAGIQISSGNNIGLICGLVAAAIGILLLMVASCVFLIRRSRRLKARMDDERDSPYNDNSKLTGADMLSRRSQEAHLHGDWHRFDYEDVVNATGNFSEESLLGRGGCSTVYKGTLQDGKDIAVKVIRASREDVDSGEDYIFKTEVSTMGRIRHKNLVCLRGCLQRGLSKIIVLDYCANGSLGDALTGSGPFLDWPTRLRIAEDAARGISYLHNDIVPAVLHRDIKPSNILLDTDLNALVADFGLAKHMALGQSQVETRVGGTFGFLAPEVFLLGGTATKAADVFAFGGVLLVLITGRPIFVAQPDGTFKPLIKWIFDRTHPENPTEYIDARLRDGYSTPQAIFLLRLALGCMCQPELRPTMANIYRLLSELNAGTDPTKLTMGLPPISEEDVSFQYSSGPSGHYSWSSKGSFSMSSDPPTILPNATVISVGR